MQAVEVCTNDEVLSESVCNGYSLDYGAWGSQIALEYFQGVTDALDDAGIPFILAKGQRSTHPGWLGARFAFRAGAIGTFDNVTREIAAKLEDADIAGWNRATTAAVRINANTTPTDDQYRTYAIHNIGRDGEIEIENDAEISASTGGAYVAAWVWVSNNQIGGDE